MQPGSSHQVKGSYTPGSRHLWVGYLVSSHSGLRANHQSRRFKTGILGILLNSLLLSNVQAFKQPCLHHFSPKSEEKLDTQHSAPFPLICPYLLFAAQKSQQNFCFFDKTRRDVFLNPSASHDQRGCQRVFSVSSFFSHLL